MKDENSPKEAQLPKYDPEVFDVFRLYYGPTVKRPDSEASSGTTEELLERHIDMGDAFAEMDKLYSDCLMAEVMTPAKPGVEIPEVQKGGNCVRTTPPALVPHHHHRKKTELKPSIPFEPILRLCELFPFLLPAKVRREAYAPAS